MKAFYSEEPHRHETDNDGTRLFRWNIESYTDEDENIQWKCDEVRFRGSCDKHTIKKAIIRSRYDETKEFALINKYNAHKEGIKVDEEAEQAYLDYLNFTFELDAILETL